MAVRLAVLGQRAQTVIRMSGGAARAVVVTVTLCVTAAVIVAAAEGSVSGV